MSDKSSLINAVTAGDLAEVTRLLNGGVHPDSADDERQRGAALALASFRGNLQIVLELLKFGAQVNPPGGNAGASPLALAIRAGKKEVVRTLLERGANLPEGVETGLSENEVVMAILKSIRNGYREERRQAPRDDRHFEEIEIKGIYGINTTVLDQDIVTIAEKKYRK